MRSPRGVRALACYRELGPAARVHTVLRWTTSPFAELRAEVPVGARVLDLGCGHGVLSLDVAIERAATVVAVDVDAQKVEVARRAVNAAVDRGWIGPGTIEVIAAGPEWAAPVGAFDVVAVVDVLYLLGGRGRSDLLARAAAALRPEGVLLVKESGDVPRWKVRLALAQEFVSVRVLRITAGEHVGVVARRAVAEELVGLGLEHVTVRPLDRGFYAPHVLVSGRHPGVGGAAGG